MQKRLGLGLIIILIALVFSGGIIFLISQSGKPDNSTFVQQYTYSIVNTYPHDPNAFTEGLVYNGSFLFESTGLFGDSTLRRVDLANGNVLQEIALPGEHFGEGITIVNDTIVQLTWQSEIGFVYNINSFEVLKNFTYPTEGWGLTFDGENLIMSDGSENLFFLDPTNFQRTSQIKVHDGNSSVFNLNELEFVNGEVYANIWLQQKIAIINPETGAVRAWIDLTGLGNSIGENVLNGIAYDGKNNRLFVTGKDWPQLFEIRLVPSKLS
jgi:glutaminyl-peptide cyclotransferase